MEQDATPVFVFGCISCGKTVSGNEPSCPRCGTSFKGLKFECPFCGELVSPSDHRCTSCGTEFATFAEDVADTSSVSLDGARTSGTADSPAESVEFECPNCGKSVSENDRECPHCGAVFQ